MTQRVEAHGLLQRVDEEGFATHVGAMLGAHALLVEIMSVRQRERRVNGLCHSFLTWRRLDGHQGLHCRRHYAAVMLHPTLLSPNGTGFRPHDMFAPIDLPAVYETACRLKVASLAGTTGDRPLLGKNIALLRARPPASQLSVLHRAAFDLGARVAHVRLGAPIEPNGIQFRGLSQMLGRLYDAIDCAFLMPEEVRQIERHAGVPVCDDLESADHPARAIADLMTLREHGCMPGSTTQIAFLGDPLSRRAENFFELACEAGICLRQFEPAGPTEGGGFLVDALDADRWVLHSPSGAIDAEECTENHRFVLQAMLLATIN